jgi:hypothetical protein
MNVYSDFARYEETLMRFGKVPVDLDSIDRVRMVNTSSQIFLYEIGQMSDENESRATTFRNDLQKFFELKSPFPPIIPRNVNTRTKTHPNAIHICDDRYNDLRETLIARSYTTRHWIRDKFMKSEEVMIGGDDKGAHFLELLDQWSEDPCI